MIYEIFDDKGNSLGNIVADEAFVNSKYPGRYRLIGLDNLPPPVIKALSLKGRLTDAEEAAFDAAKDSNAYAKEFIDMTTDTSPPVALGSCPPQDTLTAGLVSTGLLTQERVDMVFSTIVTPTESPFYG